MSLTVTQRKNWATAIGIYKGIHPKNYYQDHFTTYPPKLKEDNYCLASFLICSGKFDTLNHLTINDYDFGSDSVENALNETFGEGSYNSIFAESGLEYAEVADHIKDFLFDEHDLSASEVDKLFETINPDTHHIFLKYKMRNNQVKILYFPDTASAKSFYELNHKTLNLEPKIFENTVVDLSHI